VKLAILQNVVAPTRHALFEALASHDGIDLTVLFMARSEARRGWRGDESLGYPHRFLPGIHLPLPAGGDADVLHLNSGIGRHLAGERYDVLLSAGLLSPTAWLAFVAARRADTRFLLWFGSSWPPTGLRSSLAAPLKRAIVRGSDGIVAYGSAAREQALALGADPERVGIALNTTGVAAFAATDRDAARATLGVEGRVVLWCGRFVPRKRVDLALSFAARLSDVEVVLVGSGAGRETAERQARALGVRARFLGEVGYAELPALYAAADLFVTRAEREPWGLVVNEALASGLPVVASTGVVAARELVPPGGGCVSDDEDQLVAAAEDLIGRSEARARARSVLPRITPEAWAVEVVAQARRALRHSRR
jgi:glycosyltransferase involved in cell wall biosynthesis